MKNNIPKIVLTIAGSDSGGGAGIQGDLKTFQNNKVFGTTVITTITSQNSRYLKSIHELNPKLVKEQLECVLEDFDIKAIKTGMLYSEKIIKIVSQTLKDKAPNIPLIIDPVMISSTGFSLFLKKARNALLSFLPQAKLITPNITEAEDLLNTKIQNKNDMKNAIYDLYKIFGTSIFLKGGHLPFGNVCTDLFYDGKKLKEYTFKFINTKNTHGTGCTISAAICANIALGFNLENSILNSRKYLQKILEKNVFLGTNQSLSIGSINHNY